MVEHLIVEKAGLDAWGMLILIMAIVFFLGFFLDWLEITLIVLPVFTPLVAGLISVTIFQRRYKILVYHSFGCKSADVIFNPAFGFALFYMKGIAPREIKIQSIYKGIIRLLYFKHLVS